MSGILSTTVMAVAHATNLFSLGSTAAVSNQHRVLFEQPEADQQLQLQTTP